MKRIIITAVCVSLLAFGGCGQKQENPEVPQVEETNVSTDNADSSVVQIMDAETEEVVAEVAQEEEAPILDLELVQPNEIGEVMVVMYHSLGESNSAYVRTTESFRADLERLYAMGFRAISLEDYVNNNITTPAGYTPVVLTFDDGHSSNFTVNEENGELVTDPDCVVGILEAFYEAHPDFGLEATFFLNGGTPFKQKEYVAYKLNYIVEKGMDLGNHSTGHEHLPQLNAAQIQKTLGGNIQAIEGIVPGYEVKTLALPFGERPKDDYLDSLVTAGEYEGVAYAHNAV
ncbi:MAG: polysaccharide deacetylase family protein, partial [Clostridia bacterium]|nr:polysaccharide deacetylase family protein [Clostridia bacterium]